MAFLKLRQIDDVFVDALLADQGRLLFLSCWAPESRAQEFIAKLSLPETAQGFLGGGIIFERPDGAVTSIDLPLGASFEKEQARMPAAALFGDRMVHLMVFDPLVRAADKANRKALAIRKPDAAEADLNDRLWRLIASVATIPLVAPWRDPVIAAFREEGWVYDISGFGVDATMTSLGDAPLERWISHKLKSGALAAP